MRDTGIEIHNLNIEKMGTTKETKHIPFWQKAKEEYEKKPTQEQLQRLWKAASIAACGTNLRSGAITLEVDHVRVWDALPRITRTKGIVDADCGVLSWEYIFNMLGVKQETE